MLRFLARTALVLLGNALGLIAAAILLPGFQVEVFGFIFAVLFFTAVETLLHPFIVKVSLRYAPALNGGTALVTTFVGLVLSTLLTSGIHIQGLETWIVAPLIIWVATLLAGIVLPMVLFKKVLNRATEK